MANSPTKKDTLGKSKHVIMSRSTKLSTSARKPVAMTKPVKRTIINNGPAATAFDVINVLLTDPAAQAAVCTTVSSCGIITAILSSIADHEIRIDDLEAVQGSYVTCSTVATCPVIANLITTVNNLTGSVAAVTDPYYQTIETIGGGVHPQRDTMAFGPEFIITDELVDTIPTGRTLIQIDPAYLGGGGGSGTDDYVSSGSYAVGTNVLTLNRILGGTVNIPLTGLGDQLVKVGSTGTATYLNANEFISNGTDIQVKKQMSVTADANGLRLVGDVGAPGNAYYYGTNGVGAKGFFPVPGASQIVNNLTAQNTLTVTHNLNKYPTVLCIDFANKLITPAEVTYTDLNNITVTFLSAFTGRVVVS